MKVKHIPNAGFRFSSDFGEFTIAVYSRQKAGVTFNDQEVVDYCAATQRFFGSLGGFSLFPEMDKNDILKPPIYEDHHGPIYKYVSDLDWRNYYSRGSIKIDRLGSYISDEYGTGRQDFWEGFGSAFVFDGIRESTVFFRAIPSTHIFCATHSGIYRKDLAERFGERFIEIGDPKKFFEIVAELTGTNYKYNKKVLYNSVKAARYEEPLFSDRMEILLSRTSDKDTLITGSSRKFCTRFFEKAHDIAVLSKPRSVTGSDGKNRKLFEAELETRAVFASSIDRNLPLITEPNANIAACIRLVR